VRVCVAQILILSPSFDRRNTTLHHTTPHTISLSPLRPWFIPLHTRGALRRTDDRRRQDRLECLICGPDAPPRSSLIHSDYAAPSRARQAGVYFDRTCEVLIDISKPGEGAFFFPPANSRTAFFLISPLDYQQYNYYHSGCFEREYSWNPFYSPIYSSTALLSVDFPLVCVDEPFSQVYIGAGVCIRRIESSTSALLTAHPYHILDFVRETSVANGDSEQSENTTQIQKRQLEGPKLLPYMSHL